MFRTHWKKIKKILAFGLFMIIAVYLWVHLSYLMRLRSFESSHLTGFNSEKDLDVIFIGGSSIEVYWEPFRVWLDYGIASYDYSTSGVFLGDELGIIRQAEKRNSPKLYVIETRSYAWAAPDTKINRTRNVIDQMDINPNRFITVREGLELDEKEERTEDCDSYYFDILKYHTNTSNLASREPWEYINNDVESDTKGFLWMYVHSFIEPQEEWPINDSPLNSYTEKSLRKVLEYAKRKNIQLLFVTMPYVPSEEVKERHNTVDRIVEEYGFPTLNMCKDIKDMNMDYSKDFYNVRHVTVYGAEKVTNKIGTYLVNNYIFDDHRDDPQYADYDKKARDAMKVEEDLKQWIDSEIERKTADAKRAEMLPEIDDFPNWYAEMMDNPSLSLFAVTKGGCYETTGITGKILSEWNMNKTSGGNRYWIYSEGNTNDDSEAADIAQGEIRASERHWMVTRRDDEASVLINDHEYSLQHEGINIVTWDNNFSRPVDSVVLIPDGQGGVKMLRKDDIE